MLCLGIESSCDETALALVEDGHLRAQVLATQASVHALFGGVVPELASREHYRAMGPLFDLLLRKAGCAATAINAVAVSRGPGLLGALLVGVAFAKGLALALDVPLVGVNHLDAHVLAVGLEREIPFPALGLLVSGGHTHICHMRAPWDIAVMGRTLDDAAGEAFDKTGKLLGLPYPGGAMLDALARRGRADPALFPRPYLDNDNLDFSFSGLKTAAATHVREHPELAAWGRVLAGLPDLTTAPQALCDVCASFNLAVVDTLRRKVERALERLPAVRALVVAGGVAANALLRESLGALMRQRGGVCLVPSPPLCTDNAAMVAYLGGLLRQEGLAHPLDMEAIPRGRAIPDDCVRM